MKNNNRDFSRSIQPYLPRIKQLALKLCGNKSDAEDLIQDALIKIYPVFFELDESKNIGAWIARVIYNCYIDFWRRQRSGKNIQLVDISHHPDAFEFETDSTLEICPSLIIELNEQQQKATRYLYQMKNEHRILLIMHDIEGYTLSELTSILDIPSGTIKSRLHRARQKLKDLIIENEEQRSEYVA